VIAATSTKTALSGRVVLVLRGKKAPPLAAGRYVVHATAFTDRWQSPLRALKFRVRAKG
jgi:hypothetical protein